MKLRYCRICGKKGIRFASDGCKYCGSDYVTNTQWQFAKQKGLTKGKVIKKKEIWNKSKFFFILRSYRYTLLCRFNFFYSYSLGFTNN